MVGKTWTTIAATVQDSVAEFATSNGQRWLLSRHFGLVQGPRWLGGIGSVAGSAEMHSLPTAFSQSVYNPAFLFDLSPGDELGYEFNDEFGGIPCFANRRLRIITQRRVTADSIIITYREQIRMVMSGAPGCIPAGAFTSPASSGSWAIPLRPSAWNSGAGPDQPASLRLLTYEYGRMQARSGFAFVMAGSLQPTYSCRGLANGYLIPYRPLYGATGSSGPYNTGLDAAAWVRAYSKALGEGIFIEQPRFSFTIDVWKLGYFRKVDGALIVCGSRNDYAGLLTTHTAQAAAIATLCPNPAAGRAMLTFATSIRAEATLTLTDALGRAVWQATIAAGQTTVLVPLTGLPAGVYLLRVGTPHAAPTTWKITHE